MRSPSTSTQGPGYAEVLRGDLGELLGDREAPVRDVLDLAATADAVDGAPGPDLRDSAEVVLALDTWLRDYDVTLDL